jgi:hypothetical protein
MRSNERAEGEGQCSRVRNKVRGKERVSEEERDGWRKMVRVCETEGGRDGAYDFP